MKKLKKYAFFLLALILLFQITACRNADNDNDNANGIGNSGNSNIINFSDYIFLPHEIDMSDLDDLWDPVSGAMAHGEYIVFWYLDYPDIIITKLTSDGEKQHEIRLPQPDDLYEVKGLMITDDNHYTIVATTLNASDEATVYYITYDEHGEEMSKQEILNILRYSSSFISLEYVVITNNNIVIVTKMENYQTLYVLTADGEKLGELPATTIKGVVQLKDNRVVALFNEGTSSSLREINLSTGGWGETHRLEVSDVNQLIPADTTQPFDFFFSTGGYLIGYILETNTQTTLLNWLESGTAVSPRYFIGMLPDYKIFTLLSEHTSRFGNISVFTDLTVLTRTLRTDYMEQRTVITIGGMYIRQDLLNEIALFNIENNEYHIEIREYFSEEIGIEGSMLRMNVELITGRGPDIIVEGSFMGNTEFLADLYTFIDADPELDRIDFFPNVLRAMERSDGKLPFISNSFSVSTMIAKPETAKQLTPLTFDTILRNFDETNPSSFAGSWLSNSFFIFRAISNSKSFIDWDKGLVDFTNDEFINLLEIATHLPDATGSYTVGSIPEYDRFRNGEQLLLLLQIFDINAFRFAQVMAQDEHIVAVGEPTISGGQHIIHILGDLGINASSSNQDAAWSFIRRLLLPQAHTNISHIEIPLRINDFEKQIAELMTPEFSEFDFPMLGIAVGDEMPKSSLVIDEEYTVVHLYAMTEDEALEIRRIIDSAVMGTRADVTIGMIIEEEIHTFLNGSRSSADTARILQNRIQTYLNEQR